MADDGKDAAHASHAWLLRLYVVGSAPRSSWAIRNVIKLVKEHLDGRCDLEIIDIYQQPALAGEAELVAAPTLIKERPLPRQRFIGTMADTRRILTALGLDADAGGVKGSHE